MKPRFSIFFQDLFVPPYETDAAKLIYQNVTLEKIQLLRILNNREERSEAALHVLETLLQVHKFLLDRSFSLMTH